MESDKLAKLYPPLGLRISAGDLTLRLFRDSDLPAYAELISSRLFADEDAPHVFAWWARDPDVRRIDGLQHLWSGRASIKPEAWALQFGVFEGDRLECSRKSGGVIYAASSWMCLNPSSYSCGVK